MRYALIVIVLMLGNAMGWYANNLQFFTEYWKDKPILSNFLMGFPAGIAYWYATKMMMDINPELWSARFISAAISYLVFPFLTWYHLGESMLSVKTMLCVSLSLCILGIQIFLK